MSTTIKTIERKPRTPPPAGEQPPLMLLLHGFGSNERDLFGFAEHIDPRMHVVSARGPLDVGYGYAWYQLGGGPGNLRPDPASRARALELLTSFVTDLPARVGSDARRTYVLGFSQGAIMSLALAAHIPAQLAGIIPVSGYLDTDLLAGGLPAAMGKLDILQIHGTYDEVIPVAAAHKTRALLQNGPARFSYQEYPIGHTISIAGLERIRSWLAEQLDTPRRL